jgi:pimeloyl-ACP methyl ester carboxylesterase
VIPYDPVADTAAVLAELRVERPAVLAFGDAAGIALRLAARNDSSIRALILVVPQVGALIVDDPELGMDAQTPSGSVNPDVDPIFKATIEHDIGQLSRLLSEDPNALPPGHPARALVQDMVEANIKTVYDDVVLSPYDSGIAAAASDLPTLLITNDRPGLRFARRALRRQLGRLSEIHLSTPFDLVNLVLPQAFNAAVLEYLSPTGAASAPH